MALLFPVLLICLFGGVYGHMGISDLQVVGVSGKGIEPREKPVVFDNYRFPNAGHCHGVPPGASQKTIAVGDTVKLTLSGGAAHNGGHCALFLAKKTDNEAVWYKQMDKIDCTLIASFDWLVVGALVPAECNTAEGCGLIWTWSPKSSGACEIYMNCWNLQITGSNGGASPVGAHTVPKNPVCARINAAKQTTSFGTFCDTDCNKGGGTVNTQSPTSSPVSGQSLAPTASAGCNNCRCGTSWTDANAKCGSTCTAATESTKCGSEKCWADMVRLCESTPTTQGTTEISTCKAVGVWSGMPSIDRWCSDNCATTCPASHCQCSSNTINYIDKSVGVYQPVCQEYTVQSSTTSMLAIVLLYDLSSYQLNQNGANETAATELLNYNKACNPALSSATIKSNLPQGTNIFITGDCQMTDKCVMSGATKGFGFSGTISILFGMWFIASL